MLGLPYDVQSGEDGDDQIMLLQLGSDWYGPRFMWWDMGNLTFFIRRENLAELEFDEASAVIEGY